MGVDLLFCPFTGPEYYHPGVPLVCLIHDVQFIFHPANFTPLELYRRKKQFREACKLSQAVICDSDFVRKTLLDAKFVASDRIHRIYLRIFSRLHKFFPVEHSGQFLKTLHLETNHFLLYAANFWPHKNHHVLLRAFAMYHNRHPDSDLRLVCVGNPFQFMQRIEEEATLLNVHKWVSFPGFVSDHELAALFQSCLALIHPSLYEGFGLPLLEAMAFNKPVLCSSLGSLPEVAGDAALYFDPRNVDEIVARIEEIETSQELVKALIKKGQRRLTHFGEPAEMAKEYLDVFHSVLRVSQLSKGLEPHRFHHECRVSKRRLGRSNR